jgi:hypothetical protein
VWVSLSVASAFHRTLVILFFLICSLTSPALSVPPLSLSLFFFLFAVIALFRLLRTSPFAECWLSLRQRCLRAHQNDSEKKKKRKKQAASSSAFRHHNNTRFAPFFLLYFLTSGCAEQAASCYNKDHLLVLPPCPLRLHSPSCCRRLLIVLFFLFSSSFLSFLFLFFLVP